MYEEVAEMARLGEMTGSCSTDNSVCLGGEIGTKKCDGRPGQGSIAGEDHLFLPFSRDDSHGGKAAGPEGIAEAAREINALYLLFPEARFFQEQLPGGGDSRLGELNLADVVLSQ